jgi:hypothetical protein
MKARTITLCWLAVLGLYGWVEAQTRSSAKGEQEAVRAFVQQFYAWYVPRALEPRGGDASDLALKYKRQLFSAELFRALKDDSDAQAKVKGEIVGLDWDPFLNSQDPCSRYEVGSATRDWAGVYSVEVFGVCWGRRSDKPEVIAKVGREHGRIVFVNFSAGRDGDLLAALRLSRQARERSKPTP